MNMTRDKLPFVRLRAMEPEDLDTLYLVENDDLVNFSPQHRRAELSIVIKKDKRHRGYAMAAISQIRKYALDILHLHQLYVIVEKGNTASVALFRKMGFTTLCELTDWLYDGKNYKNSIIMQTFL